jgi:peptide-methionine (S)-S-oxide reductase
MYSTGMTKTILLPALLAAMFFQGTAMSETKNAEKAGQAAETSEKYPFATFAAGCFWGIEHAFSQVPGVKATRVGFMGGDVDNPSYKRVCAGDTRHAEVVQLRYDPNAVSYEKLVRVFFLIHDPTTLNRQGPDVGDQYRSAVFTHEQEQMKIAQAVKDELTNPARSNAPSSPRSSRPAPSGSPKNTTRTISAKTPAAATPSTSKKSSAKSASNSNASSAAPLAFGPTPPLTLPLARGSPASAGGGIKQLR